MIRIFLTGFLSYFQIRIAFIWGFSILLAIPQLIAFRVELVSMDASNTTSVPQCLPVNISPMVMGW